MELSPEQFSDYRHYLAAWFSARKRKSRTYSAKVFAKRAGLASHTYLPMVIRGQRNLTYKTIRQFVQGLGLRGREALFFEKLVQLNQSTREADQRLYRDQLAALRGQPGPEFKKVARYEDYFCGWLRVALRELVGHPDFRPEAEWMSRALGGKATEAACAEAWSVLCELGLVAKDASGRYRHCDAHLEVVPEGANEVVREYHLKQLELAVQMAKEPLSEREFSSATVLISSARLAELRDRVRVLRREVLSEFSKRSPGEPVSLVSVNVQLLCLTKSNEECGS